MSKKINTSDIDEKALLASIFGKKNPEHVMPSTELPNEGQDDTTIEKEEAKPKDSGRKKKKEADTDLLAFLQKKSSTARQCVYISQHIHEIISKIVYQVADKNVTVGGYIDIVMTRHFENNKEELNALYRQKKEDLIK